LITSLSFARNALRGFWPGLGAKSWASAGMAANQSDRCLSLATIKSPQVIPARPIPLSAVKAWVTCEFPKLKINCVRIAAGQRFRAEKFSVLSRAIAKLRLEVPAAIENAFDEHRIRRHDEGNSHATLESGQQIVALRSPQRKCGETVAEIDDAPDIAVRALLTRMRRDVLMQACRCAAQPTA
jgi:hypothetical protein